MVKNLGLSQVGGYGSQKTATPRRHEETREIQDPRGTASYINSTKEPYFGGYLP
jgi:hypothetical protein